MKPSNDYKPNLAFGLLLCGLPGTGKTTGVLRAFPAPYVADCDNNLSSAARTMVKESKEFWFDTMKLENGKEVADSDCWLRLMTEIKVATLQPNIKTIVVDSLTTVSDFLMWHILKKQNRTDGKMQIQDWGTLKETMAKFVTACRSQGKLVVFTAHEKYDKDESTGRMKFSVNWPGQFADIMPGYFSDFWQCQTKVVGDKVSYVVRTQPTPYFALKNSLGLPPELELTQENITKYLSVLS